MQIHFSFPLLLLLHRCLSDHFVADPSIRGQLDRAVQIDKDTPGQWMEEKTRPDQTTTIISIVTNDKWHFSTHFTTITITGPLLSSLPTLDMEAISRLQPTLLVVHVHGYSLHSDSALLLTSSSPQIEVATIIYLFSSLPSSLTSPRVSTVGLDSIGSD